MSFIKTVANFTSYPLLPYLPPPQKKLKPVTATRGCWMKWPHFLLIAVLLSTGLLAQDLSARGDCSVPGIKLTGYGYYMLNQLAIGELSNEWEEPTASAHLWSNSKLTPSRVFCARTISLRALKKATTYTPF